MIVDRVRISRLTWPLATPVRTAIHHLDRIEHVLVEISAEGLTGHGYAFVFRERQADAVALLVDDLTTDLPGRDAGPVRGLWDKAMARLDFAGAAGPAILALAAVDTALWDLLAQRDGVALHELLGSQTSRLPAYATGGWLSMSEQELSEEAGRFAEAGFGRYKLKVGHADWRVDVRRVRSVRETMPGMELLVDANQGWDVATAIDAAQALGELGVHWLEEPVAASDVEGTARVRRSGGVAIAAGETISGPMSFGAILQARAVDVLMPDLMRCGGPTGFLRVAEQAGAAGVPVSSHTFPETSVHLLAACPNAGLVEFVPGWWDGMIDGMPNIDGGDAVLGSAPGSGWTFSARAQGRAVTVRDGRL